MSSALRQNLPAPAGTFSCSRARIYTCSFLNSATSISGPKSNFVIRYNFKCTSSNIIYCISCSKCCKLYIGETGRRLSDRFAEMMLTSLLCDILMLLTTLFPISKFVPSHAFLVVKNWNHSSPRA